MKVISKQRNSRMCAICGMDNKYGLKAQFYGRWKCNDKV
jgi:hypothetical protein